MMCDNISYVQNKVIKYNLKYKTRPIALKKYYM